MEKTLILPARSVAEREPDDDLQALMSLAIRQGPDGIEALRQLVELRRQEEDRQAARDFAAAMAAFQADGCVVEYNAVGAHNARYATLDQIMQTIRPALAANGLSVTFDSDDTDPRRLRITCTVHHAAGHSRTATMAVPREDAGKRMNVSQAAGSAMSYGRRYSLCLALGIATGDRDDDAQAAGELDNTPVSAERADYLRSLARDVGADPERFFRFLAKRHGVTVDTWVAIPARIADDAEQALKARGLAAKSAEESDDNQQ